MSFFFETISIPFWFIVFIFASAAPLWFKWYRKFYNKFIVTGILKRRFKRAKSLAEMKIDVLKKATEHWDDNGKLSGFSEKAVKKRQSNSKNIDPVKKNNIKIILKVLAEAGEKGILPKSISDNAGTNSVETNSALVYLTDKSYVEVINSTNGVKYYLTDLGRRYCINKKII